MKSFQDFRNVISIMEMAASIGYTYDQKKGSKWPVLVNGYNNEKIIIVNPRSALNQGYFNPNDDMDKGTLIDFVKNRLGRDFPYDRSLSEPMNINKVLYAFNKELLPEPAAYTPGNRPQKPFTTEGLTDRLVKSGYLLSRNISRKTLSSKEFTGRVLNIKNGDFNNVAFPFYNKDETMVGIEKRNFSYDMFVEGSQRTNSIWHSNIPRILDKIVIAESAIDAISYHQLKPSKNVLYVSIGGSLSFGQIDVIKALKIRSNVSDGFYFISATDNDKAGNKYDQKLAEWLTPDKLLIDKPLAKDYNKDLENSIINNLQKPICRRLGR